MGHLLVDDFLVLSATLLLLCQLQPPTPTLLASVEGHVTNWCCPSVQAIRGQRNAKEKDRTAQESKDWKKKTLANNAQEREVKQLKGKEAAAPSKAGYVLACATHAAPRFSQGRTPSWLSSSPGSLL